MSNPQSGPLGFFSCGFAQSTHLLCDKNNTTVFSEISFVECNSSNQYLGSNGQYLGEPNKGSRKVIK